MSTFGLVILYVVISLISLGFGIKIGVHTAFNAIRSNPGVMLRFLGIRVAIKARDEDSSDPPSAG